MSRILLVEDDQALLTALEITIRSAGYDVACATTAAQGVAAAAADPPDLVILDLGLPDRDGTWVIESLRAWTGVPIVVLSGRTDGTDKVAALDAGADDYVTKPFVTDELLARLRAAERRRTDGDPRPRVALGGYVVDLAARTVTPSAGPAVAAGAGAGAAAAAGGPVTLTPTEWAVLELLLRRPGRLIGTQEIIRTVWGSGHRKDTDSVRTYLARLRRKLEADPARPRHLLTEPGMGYRFRP